VPDEANRRGLFFLDATCPLVSKVHYEAQHLYDGGHLVLLIGHKGHPEVIGTMGQLPPGAVVLIQTLEDVQTLEMAAETSVAYVTQTTLSVDETKEIAAALKLKFPHIREPRKDDICYATTNRQMAVKAIAPRVDRLIVIGAENSSNSVRLVEVAKVYGCPESRLYADASQVDWQWLQGAKNLGLSAGASAPEILVEELIAACRERYEVTLEGVNLGEENVHFNLPRILEGV
jgi:4-hydroxy-3-methylbut-2-enyl diphosphate reductase